MEMGNRCSKIDEQQKRGDEPRHQIDEQQAHGDEPQHQINDQQAHGDEPRKQIDDQRHQIDELDKQIVELLNKRAQHALAIRNLKPAAHMSLYDPVREEEILQTICALNEGPLYDENLRDIYTTLLRVMKEVPLS